MAMALPTAMRRRAACWFLLLCIQALPFAAHAERLETRVVDEAGVFSSAQRESLNAAAERLRTRRHIEFVVLTVTSLGGDSIENLASTRFKRYELGTRGIDNGLLLVIAINEHKSRLEVGYGLEGALPDLAANRLLQNELPPYFQKGAYSDGVLSLVAKLDAADLRVQQPSTERQSISTVPFGIRFVPLALAGFFFLFIFFMGYRGELMPETADINAVFGHAWPDEAVAYRARMPRMKAIVATLLWSFITLNGAACVGALFGGDVWVMAGIVFTFLSGFVFIGLMQLCPFSAPWKKWHARYDAPIRARIEKHLKSLDLIYSAAAGKFISAPSRSSGSSSDSSSSSSSSSSSGASSSSSSPSDGGSSGGGGSSGSW